jgi:hypothetical protein
LAVRAVRAVVVVTVLVLAKRGCGVPQVDDEDAVRSSRRMLPTKRLAIGLALGARPGVLTMRTSSAVNTASKVAVNL